jgi:hypothetical protein
MIATALDLIFYMAGLMALCLTIGAGIFLTVAGYYFITDKIKGE